MDVIDSYGMSVGYRVGKVAEALEGCEALRREKEQLLQQSFNHSTESKHQQAKHAFEQKQRDIETERRRQERLAQKKRRKELRRILKEEKEVRKMKRKGEGSGGVLHGDKGYPQPEVSESGSASASAEPRNDSSVRQMLRGQWLRQREEKKKHTISTTAASTIITTSSPRLPPSPRRSTADSDISDSSRDKLQKLNLHETTCSGTTTTTTTTHQSTDSKRHCLVQVRMPSGETVRHSFSQSDPFERVIQQVRQHDSLLESDQSFCIMTPFPRHVILDSDWNRSINDVLGGASRVSLVIQFDSQKGTITKGQTFSHAPVAPAPGGGTGLVIGMPFVPPGGVPIPGVGPLPSTNEDDTSVEDPLEDNGQTNWSCLMVRTWCVSRSEVSNGFMVYRPEGHRMLEIDENPTSDSDSNRRGTTMTTTTIPEILRFRNEEFVSVSGSDAEYETWSIQLASSSHRNTTTSNNRSTTQAQDESMELIIGKRHYIVHMLTSQVLILRRV